MISDYEKYLKEEWSKCIAENVIKQNIINRLNQKVDYYEGRINPAMFKNANRVKYDDNEIDTEA
tara:strand:- start:22 stop:213 length:192 start_codon:yes stop_codon:yes gene_type:complete